MSGRREIIVEVRTRSKQRLLQIYKSRLLSSVFFLVFIFFLFYFLVNCVCSHEPAIVIDRITRWSRNKTMKLYILLLSTRIHVYLENMI